MRGCSGQQSEMTSDQSNHPAEVFYLSLNPQDGSISACWLNMCLHWRLLAAEAVKSGWSLIVKGFQCQGAWDSQT